ncbi:MAG: hypothetical protein GTN69_01865 [Armatimonadetes bacterium]|nr:hypothetical protein [Armatimonadota bacterium]
MIFVELPAGYIDAVATASGVGLYVVNTVPEEDSVDAPVDTTITVELFSTSAETVDPLKTEVWIDGTLAYEGNGSPKFKPGFDGPASAETVLGGHDLRVVVDPTTDFDSETEVEVNVTSLTSGSTYSVDYTYTFTTEDVINPQLVSCKALFADIVRFTFSEAMQASSATGTNDALNPANYSFEFVPEHDRQAGVSVTAVTVEQHSATEFDVTTDIVLTFWKTYRGVCGDIADDSSNANLLVTTARTATFSSWVPPDWPPRRRFDLWNQLSDEDRRTDVHGDLERLTSVRQDLTDLMLWDSDRTVYWWDPDRAPEPYVDAMLAEMGNPFRFDLSLNRKRKLIAVLPDVYKQKGTGEGLINVVRFFLGIEITEITEFNVEAWKLGYDKLGYSTVLGPGDDKALYTFLVIVERVLTDEERLQLEKIIEYMKPAHTHYRIVEPGDPEFVDHWRLGYSELGKNTLLHEAP